MARKQNPNGEVVTSIDPNRAEGFEQPLNIHGCTPRECNYTDVSKHDVQVKASTARGHLMVTHGFTAEQILDGRTKANEFYRQITQGG